MAQFKRAEDMDDVYLISLDIPATSRHRVFLSTPPPPSPNSTTCCELVSGTFEKVKLAASLARSG